MTSVKHALAHRCSLNFISEAHSNKVNVTSAPRSAPTRLVRKVTLKAAFFGRIQKRICDLRSYGFFNTKKTENDHRVENNRGGKQQTDPRGEDKKEKQHKLPMNIRNVCISV